MATIDRLELRPEGAFGIEFEFGYTCGRQKTPGIHVGWKATRRGLFVGGTFMTEDAVRLRDWLTLAIEAANDAASGEQRPQASDDAER